MFETLLLVGLMAMFAAWWGTTKRLSALEARVAELSDSQSSAPTQSVAMPNADAPTVRARFVEPVGPLPPPIAEPVAEIASMADDVPVASETLPPPPPTSAETLPGLFERFVGGRLLVWTGGIAIALAGLFLVRYSIELGLIGPRFRMIAAGVFGVILVAAGEIARRRIPDDLRVGQALVGAGVLVLYAAAYGSHVLYGLITLTTAFVLMAAVAAGALAMSLRHGTPTAALGLVGGFVTPLLVGRSTGEAEPLLGYLTLLNVAVLAVAVRSERPWLGWAAKLMTLGWTGWLLGAAPDDAVMIGAFLLAHTVATGLAWRGEAFGRDEPVPWLGPTLALAQMGAVVPIADFAPAGWLLLLGFGVAGFALAERSRVLAAVPGRALIAALLLIAGHIAVARPEPLVPWAAATTLLFAGGSWWRFGRDAGRLGPTLTYCAAIAGPALLLWAKPQMMANAGWAMLFGSLGLAAAAFAWRARGGARREAPYDTGLPIAAATAAGLFAVAVYVTLPWLWVPAGWMVVALGLAAAGRRLGDGGVARLAVVAGGGAVLAAAGQAQPMWTLWRAAVGVPALVVGLPTPGAALVLFALPGAAAFAVWRVLPVEEAALRRVAGAAAGTLAALALYILFKQIFALRTPADFVTRGFAERTLLTQGLFFAGWLLLKRPRMAWLAAPALVLTAVAAARFVWFDVLVLNPAFVRQDVGAWPGLVLVAYGGAAFWLWEARRRAAAGVPSSIGLALFLTASIVGAGLLVRQMSQGAILTGDSMPRAEFYGYSLAGLLLSVGLLLVGTRRADTPLRVAGLMLLTATVLKVFVFDAAALEGLLRIASFAGLGGALIGMGKLYGTVLGRKASASPTAAAP